MSAFNLVLCLVCFTGGWFLGRLAIFGFLFWRMGGSFASCRRICIAWSVARDAQTDALARHGMRGAQRRGWLPEDLQ